FVIECKTPHAGLTLRVIHLRECRNVCTQIRCECNGGCNQDENDDPNTCDIATMALLGLWIEVTTAEQALTLCHFHPWFGGRCAGGAIADVHVFSSTHACTTPSHSAVIRRYCLGQSIMKTVENRRQLRGLAV